MTNPIVFHKGGCGTCNGDFVMLGAYRLIGHGPVVNGIALGAAVNSNASPIVLACLNPGCPWLRILLPARWSN